jgi:hypothetical protein
MNASNNSHLILELIAKGNYYTSVRNSLDLTLGFILFIFGLFGNLCAIYLMRSKNLSKLTISVDLIALAISDTCVLLFDNFVVWLDLTLPKYTLQELTNCKIYFPNNVGKLVSSWLITSISLDRFLLVFYPQFSKKYLSKKLCLIRITILIISSFLFNLYYLVLISSPDDITYNCIGEEPIWTQEIWPIMFTFLYSIIPSILLIFFNILIIKKTRESKKICNNNSNNGRNQVKEAPKKMNFTVIAICTSFVLLTLPANIVNIFTIQIISEGTDYSDENIIDLEYQEKRSKILYFLLVRWVTDFMMNLNHAINFFLYILSSKLFQQELVMKLKCKFGIFKLNQR